MTKFIEGQNKWWINPEFRFTIPKYTPREIDAQFERVFKTTKMISVSGLRQTGKTTLLKKKINELLDRGLNGQIFYINFESLMVYDREDFRRDIVEFIEQKIGVKLHEASQVYIFLDEIQYVDHWQDILKYFYDINSKIKFVITGSSELYIVKGRIESLLGRIFDMTMHPFTFSEYLNCVGQPLPFKTDIYTFMMNPDERQWQEWKMFEWETKFVKNYLNYLHFGYFPGVLEFSENRDKNTFINQAVYNKTLEIDIPRFYDIEKKENLKKLFHVLIHETGSMEEAINLSRELGIDRNTLYDYLTALEESRLISRVMKFQKSKRFPKGVGSKFYTASPNFTFAMQGILDAAQLLPSQIGFLVETDIFQKLKKSFDEVYFFRKGEKEIDFVLRANSNPKEKFFVEVKFERRVNPRDFRFLREQMKSEKVSNGFIFTRDYFAHDGVLWFLPAWCL